MTTAFREFVARRTGRSFPDAALQAALSRVRAPAQAAEPHRDEEYEDAIAAQALAQHYADYWNHLREIGTEPSLEESQHADDELDGTGWGVNWANGHWHVQHWPEQYYDHNEPRTPAGGVTVEGKRFHGGAWVPMSGTDLSPDDRKKVDEAKREEVKNLVHRQEKLSGKVDRAKLKAEVAQGGDADFSDAEMRSLDYGYRALKRHHGAQLLARLGQLVSGVINRLQGASSDQAKAGLKRRLAAYKIMVDRADADFPEE